MKTLSAVCTGSANHTQLEGRHRRRPLRIAKRALVAACIAFGIGGPVAFAPAPASAQQQVPPEPPGTIERRLEERSAPEAKPPAVIAVPDRPEPPRNSDRIRFVLKDLKVVGNTALSTTRLQREWENLIGKRISLTRVYQIAADLTVRYRNEGYILSRAIVPPQDIEKGVVEIEIIEGYISNVVIDGEVTGWPSQLKDKTDAIKASRPLRVADMERYMLLINDLAGLSARSVLRPSPTETGASELIIVLEETSFAASLSVDNRGTRFTGPGQATLTFDLFNILGFYETTEVRLTVARNFSFGGDNELLFGSVKHTEFLTTEGTFVELQASKTSTDAGDPLADAEIEGTATRFAATFIHPFVRTRSKNLTANLGLNYLDTETTSIDELTLNEDRIRWVVAGGKYDFVDRFRGINLISLEFAKGLDIIGARKSGSLDLSRQNGRSDFSKLNVDLVREQNLGVGFSLLGAITGQYALDQLLASQEMGFGGKDFGRGYDPFEISGEHGVAAKLEFRFGDASDLEMLESYQLYGFYDIGAVWRIDETREVGGARDSAASAGAGIRLNFSSNVFGELEVAQPLTRRPTSNRDDGKREPRRSNSRAR